jgi:monoamine oxidase
MATSHRLKTKRLLHCAALRSAKARGCPARVGTTRRLLLAAALAAPFIQPARAAEADVVVIGAGVAGFSAAHTLIGARRSVVVLEARDRTGGRVFTDASLGLAFDQGAPTRPEPTGMSLMIGGKELSHEDYQRFAKFSDDIARLLEPLHKEAPGFDPRQLIHPKDALERLAFEVLLRRLPFPPFTRLPVTEGKVPVRINTRVVRIDSTGSLVRLVTLGGEVQARAVIVTVPTGVLAAGGLSFAPPLRSERQAAIAALPMTQAEKVCVTFSRRVIDAPDDTRVVALSKQQAVIEALLRPGGREAAILTYRGEDARQLEANGASAAAAGAITALAELFGKDLRTGFLRAASTRWGLDPYARGAWADGLVEARRGLAVPHAERVFFAGEATDPAGGVAGANASGQRAAKEALAALKG